MNTHYSGHDVLEIMTEARNYNQMLETLIETHGSGTTWLDFGAGNGLFSRPFAKKIPTLHCLETDPQLQQKLRVEGLTVFDSLDRLPTQYDFIYSMNVLEHIADHEVVAQKLISLLKPGGRLLIYVPAFPSLFSPLDQKIGHHRRYTHSTLLPLFADLKTVHSSYADSLGYFASLYLKHFAQADKPLSLSSVRFYDRWIFPLSRKLDLFSRAYFGKNLLYVGEKPQP